MSDLREYLDRQLESSEFKKEWEFLEPEYQIMRAMLEARREKGVTQKELAENTGINQADISRIENGNGNPSLRTLKRIAEGLGMVLKLEFIQQPSKK